MSFATLSLMKGGGFVECYFVLDVGSETREKTYQ